MYFFVLRVLAAWCLAVVIWLVGWLVELLQMEVGLQITYYARRVATLQLISDVRQPARRAFPHFKLSQTSQVPRPTRLVTDAHRGTNRHR